MILRHINTKYIVCCLGHQAYHLRKSDFTNAFVRKMIFL